MPSPEQKTCPQQKRWCLHRFKASFREPASPDGVRLNGLIERLQRANSDLGITLFVIEHNMRVIMNLATHIYCLAHGELLAQGPPETVQNDQRVIDAYLGAH